MKNSQNRFLNSDNQYCLPKITLEPIHTPDPLLLASKPESIITIPFEIRMWSSVREALKSIINNRIPNSEVSIATTTQSSYLTSCFENLFDKGIGRSKKSTNRWDIFAADFGYQNLEISSSAIIYDDAWSFDIDVANNFLHSGGMYYISSIPKIIGLPFGAIVLTRDLTFQNDPALSDNILVKLDNYFSWFLLDYHKFAIKRKENYEILNQLLGIEFYEFMNSYQTDFPGVGVFGVRRKFDEIEFKSLLQKNGVRGTSFFGNNAIILPIHQNLSRIELEYIAEVSVSIVKKCFI